MPEHADRAASFDEEAFRSAQRRVMLGSILTILASLSAMIPPILALVATVIIGVDMAQAGGLSGAAGTQAAVSIILAVVALLALLPPVVVLVMAVLSWRLRSEQLPVITGISVIVLACVYGLFSLCTLSLFGCLVLPMLLIVGLAGGILLILAAQDPQVIAAIRARNAVLAEDG